MAVTSPDDPVVSLEPLLSAFRQERYTFIKNIHIWDLPLPHTEIATLVRLINGNDKYMWSLIIKNTDLPDKSGFIRQVAL